MTNLVETLTAEVVLTLLPPWAGRSVTVLEHYPPAPGLGLPHRRTDSYSRVTFATWEPRRYEQGRIPRWRLGTPGWAHLSHDEVALLIGAGEVAPC